MNCGCAAGVYTSSILLPLCATLLESFGALDKLPDYVSTNGRRFYGLGASTRTVTLHKVIDDDSKAIVPESYTLPAHAGMQDGEKGKVQVVPFWSGKSLAYTLA